MSLLVAVGCGSSGTSNTDAGGGKGGSGGKGGGAGGAGGTIVGGTGGSTAGTGGSTAGTGGSAAGTGGHAGTGGSAAGTGGHAGTGGSAAGTGGGTAGTGGSAAGAGGSVAGAGGHAGTGGGAGQADAGTDARKDAESDAQTDAHDAAPVCTNACVLGAHRCANGGSEMCVLGSNGCTEWGATSLCAGVTTCLGSTGLCTCPAAPTGCSAAGTFCDTSGGLVTCQRDAQGCFSTSAPVACPTDTSCKGTLPNAACTCDNGCATAGNFCVNPQLAATCGNDSNTPACLVITSSTGCFGSSTCAGGACVCPAMGTTAGTGCPTLNATSCSGTDILTCVTESASGCSLWQASTHCGTGGLTCGTKGATPACQCPENGGADIYVDPSGGSDVASGVFPTGIQSPAACRYGSLTKGLAVVGSPGRVIAISATLPAVFGGETFPMTIPASVSILTADAVFNPADYEISTSSGGTLITLSNGSALRGFSVVGTGPAQALLACNAGSVVLDTLLLNGSGTATDGFDLSGTCSAGLTAVGIENLTGIALNDSSSGTSTNTGGSLLASLIGLQQTGGILMASGLTVENNGQYGIILPASSAGTPTLSLSGQTLVNTNGTLGTFAGISIGKGSLTASNTSANGNGGIGIQLISATGTNQLTTVQANTNGVKAISAGVALTAGTLTATGLTATANTGSGVSVTAGSAILTGAALNQNGQRGLSMSAGNVTLSGGTFNTNTGSGAVGSGGTLTIQGGAELANNTNHGVQATGAVTVIAGASIHNNMINGVLVNDSTGVTVNIGSAATTTSINGNLNDGILVNAAPATGGGANSLTIDTVAIGSNGKFGVYLQGNTGSVTATLKGSTITANGDVGIMVEQAGVNITSEAIQNNDVNGNNTGNVHTVGGILFNTSSTLSSFIGNKVHSNVGDELGFNAAPNGGFHWVINPPSAACDATANSLYCYGTGSVGLHMLVATGAVSVDAQHTHWATSSPPAPPTLGIDYSGPAGTVTATNPCTSIACP